MSKRTQSRFLYLATIALSCVTAAVVACNDSATSGSTDDLAVSAMDDLSVGGGSTPDLTPIPDGAMWVPTGDGGTRLCIPAACGGKIYACGNCLDDDGDGKIDMDDSECLGPCDNSENGLDPAIPGGNSAKCKMDCYFDGDTGSGNDSCYWDHGCDPNKNAANQPSPETSCPYNPTMNLAGSSLTCATAQTMQSTTCLNYCKPLTPNGCDCFGCCFLGPQAKNNVDGSRTGIWLGSYDASGNATCTMANLADPNKCHVCKMVDSCAKDCGRCQLCIGKDTIPADCFPPPADMAGKPPADLAGADLAGGGGSDPTLCPPSLCTNNQPCGLPGCAPCPGGWSCITGCCTPPPG